MSNPELSEERKIPERPSRRQAKTESGLRIPRPHLPRKALLGLVAVGLLAVGVNELGLSVPGVPKVHEDLHVEPPQLDDEIVVTKLGAIGAFSKSVQTYKSTAYVRLVNEDGEERETLGYKNSHRVVRTQEGKPIVTHDDKGNKTVTLPDTIGVLARGDFKVLHDGKTDRDFGQALIGWVANSQTPRELGQTMITDTIEDVASKDEISNRQTLCVGLAATSQLLSDIGYEGYFVPTWQPDGKGSEQPANTHLMTVTTKFDDGDLTIASCAKDLVKIGYDPDLAGNMHASAKESDAEVEAGMQLPERRLKPQVLKAGMDQYLKDSK